MGHAARNIYTASDELIEPSSTGVKLFEILGFTLNSIVQQDCYVKLCQPDATLNVLGSSRY